MGEVSQWRALGASVRGLNHVRSGRPNQDALRVDVQGAAAIAVVADGHGGARHFRSADGARLAVQAAHEALLALAPAFAAATAAERSQLAAVDLPQRIVTRWVELAQSDFSAHPFSDEECAAVDAGEGSEAAASVRADPLLAYGATLLAALAAPGCLVIAQLGDGDVLLVESDGKTTRPVPRDERLLGNLTTSICRAGAQADFRSIVLEGAAAGPALLLLSTDGYANSFRSDADYLQVGTDFLALLRKHGIEAVERQMPAILEDASTHGSGDDITLAMLAGDLQPLAAAAATDEAGDEAMVAARSAAQRTERRMARQRGVIAVLALLLVAVVGWTQRDRLAALWDAPPVAAEVPVVIGLPAKGGGDSGLATEAGGGAQSPADAVPPGADGEVSAGTGSGSPGGRNGANGKREGGKAVATADKKGAKPASKGAAPGKNGKGRTEEAKRPDGN